MGKIVEQKSVAVEKLIPYINNAKQHSDDQVTRIASSIREFGFLSPCVIDKDYNVLAGHGRILAAKKLGMEVVPCVFVEGLTPAQRKAYVLADNRLGELADWDMDLVATELDALKEMDFDIDLTGFDVSQLVDDTGGFFSGDRRAAERQEGNDEYNEFLDKFEAKHTTDDCYTPDNIYDCVADYVSDRYGVDRKFFVRPFYPNGDYEAFGYNTDSVVVDNPPFSILSQIVAFYTERGQRFFLFAPALTSASLAAKEGVTLVATGLSLVYENGAEIATSFVTNMEVKELVVRSDPWLWKAIKAENDKNLAKQRKSVGIYEYPKNVATAAKINYMSAHDTEYNIERCDAIFIRSLDEMKDVDKGIFGGGFLLSEKAAAEKAAAEKAAAEKAAAEKAAATVWRLSEREQQMIKSLER